MSSLQNFYRFSNFLSKIEKDIIARIVLNRKEKLPSLGGITVYHFLLFIGTAIYFGYIISIHESVPPYGRLFFST